MTNTTSRPRSALREKLTRFGIPAGEAQIFTPPIAAVSWLRSQPEGQVALFVPVPTRLEFEDLPLLPKDAEKGATYVVVGDLGEAWDYGTLNHAFRLLYHNAAAGWRRMVFPSTWDPS